MNSVLTNTGAMTALQVLNQANKSMGVTQGRVSTGLKVATADQNAAIYAMAGVMKADVAGYQTIQEGLGVAESAVSVGRAAAESIGDLLKEMKTKITSAQDGTQDRTKIQAEIDELVGQIDQIGKSASFNGLNYLKGTDNVEFLSSLNRSTTDGASYDVGSSTISFQKQDLVLGEAAASKVEHTAVGATAKNAVSSVTDVAITFDPAVGNAGTFDVSIGGVAFSTIAASPTDSAKTRTAGAMDLAANDDEFSTGTPPTDTSLATMAGVIQKNLDQAFGGDGNGTVVTASVVNGKIRITDTLGRGISGVTYTPAGSGEFNGATEVARGSTEVDAVASEVSYAFDQFKSGGSTTYAAGMISTVSLTKADGTSVDVDTSASANMGALATDLQTGLGAGYTVSFDSSSGKLSVKDADGRGIALKFTGEGSGKLGGLSSLDVTTDAGAKAALKDIETMIQDTLDSAAALGSTQKRLGIQKDFLGKLSDAVTTGIGTLVDADMTQESARLQSLQVQQQLAAQALGIANQQPQQLLGLFRG
jgi:flagellin